MHKHEILVETLPTTRGDVLEMLVDYRSGGTNLLTGGLYPRGYAIRAQLVRVQSKGGTETRTVTARSAQHIQAALRFNERVLGRLAEAAKDHPLYSQLRDHLLHQTSTALAHPTGSAADPQSENPATPDSSPEPNEGVPVQTVPTAGAELSAGQLDLFPSLQHAA